MKDDQVTDGDYEQDNGVTDDQDDDGGDEEEHLAFADLAVSARQPAGARDWPDKVELVSLMRWTGKVTVRMMKMRMRMKARIGRKKNGKG